MRSHCSFNDTCWVHRNDELHKQEITYLRTRSYCSLNDPCSSGAQAAPELSTVNGTPAGFVTRVIPYNEMNLSRMEIDVALLDIVARCWQSFRSRVGKAWSDYARYCRTVVLRMPGWGDYELTHGSHFLTVVGG